MLSEVKTIFTGSQVVARLGEVEPVIVKCTLISDDLERAFLERLVLAEIVGQPLQARLMRRLKARYDIGRI